VLELCISSGLVYRTMLPLSGTVSFTSLFTNEPSSVICLQYVFCTEYY
jgi:hypothetical protein